MGKPSAPAAPNPTQLASQQTASNVNTAAANSYLNAINQYTPYGNVIWKQTNTRQLGDGTASIPEWQVTQELSPEQQRLYNQQTALSSGALDLGQNYLKQIGANNGQNFNYDGLPAAPTYDANFRQQQVNNIVARNQPQMDRDRAALEQRLADQGIGLNDAGYRTAFDQYDRGVNDFRLGADLQGGQEAANAFNLAATTRDRAINERLQQRNQPINELTALLGFGGQGVRAPSYTNTQQVPIAPTDTITPQQMAYQGQLANYQAQQQSQNAALGGLFSLGSAGLMAGMMPGGLFGLGAAGAAAKSDIRAKEDIRHIGYTHDGQNLYAFRYIGEPETRIGLMAQEVEKVHPEAVVEINGVKHVYYDRALREAVR